MPRVVLNNSSGRILLGRIRGIGERPAPQRARETVIDLEPGVGGWAPAEETGALTVIHTISPELRERMDATGAQLRGLGTGLKIGLLVLAIAIAFAVGAALYYATTQLNRLEGVRRRTRRSTSPLKRKLAAARGRSR